MEVEILSRLPVKSLKRFMCVSKLWCELIRKPSFNSMHFENYSKNKNSAEFLLIHREGHSICLLSPNKDDSKLGLFESIHHIDLPPGSDEYLERYSSSSKSSYLGLSGPANGIICIVCRNDKFIFTCGKLMAGQTKLTLWNPSTRDFKTLPTSPMKPIPNGYCLHRGFGFCFNSKSNDYKVVELVCGKTDDDVKVFAAQVYNLSTDSWRKFDGPFPVQGPCSRFATTHRGTVLCWIASEYEFPVIVSLDMGIEEFQIIEIPYDDNIIDYDKTQLLQFDDSIALVSVRGEYCPYFQWWLDVWVMSEFGVEESWTKIFSIPHVQRATRPLGFWKNVGFLYQDLDGNLFCYDHCAKKSVKLGVHGEYGDMMALTYKDSLISISGKNRNF